MTRIVIPEHLRFAQLAASDPRASVWVSANAGSGKTHVLTQRVIRLLLQGVPPAKILCLTFTKAAAAQMATRVFGELAKWTSLDDRSLREAILETGAPAPTPPQLLLARRLFTRTVETPGGLKIQTIHAFCERLLHLFPFEANVPARFEVADDLRQALLLAQAKSEAIARAYHAGGALGDALARLALDVSSAKLEELIGEAMAKRRATHRRPFGDPQDLLSEKLGLVRGQTVASLRRDMLEGGFAPSEWPGLAAFFETGGANDKKLAAKLRRTVAHYGVGFIEAAVGDYCSAFFTVDGKPAQKLMTKALVEQRPVLLDDMRQEQERLAYLIEQSKAADILARTDALMTITGAALHEYDSRKIELGVLDFDDLIERTCALLGRSGPSWVLHKLDNGIDHVLVDEAQDTSEAQWQILDALTGDFAAGHGSRGQDRSFFAVGDDKQSIFSFQGAAPHKFHDMRRLFERRFVSGGKPFEHVRLKTSFRSVPAVLSMIDKVFDPVAHQIGLVPPGDVWQVHESFKQRLPGLVEIWPPVMKEAGQAPADWRLPVDAPDERDPASILASRIAKKIAALIAPGASDCVHDERSETPRPVRPGDVLILVRTRNAFFEAIIRALKLTGVPVAGADRLDVAHHMAVLDLVAAGRAALLPQDDLTLAGLLKSPLFGLTDDDLIILAPHRAGSLFEALAASSEARFQEAHATVERWNRHAAEETPFDFYAAILGTGGGRRKIEARLGPEAHDAIDEFLRLALAHERDSAPSLGRFLDDIEALTASIKRDMEGPGDAVRVMTVHAAKGLEAKIVFLPDTCGVPALQHEPVIFNLEPSDQSPPVFAWSPKREGDCPVITAARERARRATMDEYRRLFYVALTRAEERLYICGFRGTREMDSQCWSKMIDTVFAGDLDTMSVPADWDASETIMRRLSPGMIAAQPAAPPSLASAQAEPPPAWLLTPILRGRPAPVALRPSSQPVDAAGSGPAGLAAGAAIHEVLQYLPDLPETQRHDAARTYLESRPGLDAGTRRTVLAQALAVLAMPELARLFAPGSRAEVAILGRVMRPDGSSARISGKMDRLGLDGDTLLIADFKSGQKNETGLRETYIRQLALYRLVLRPLWPGKKLRMLLVWTAGPLIEEIGDPELDAAGSAALEAL